jgi:hypothetical protein
MTSDLKVVLSINGTEIEMNEFVQKLTGNLLYAVLKSLRLDEEPHSAVFSLKIQ